MTFQSEHAVIQVRLNVNQKITYIVSTLQVQTLSKTQYLKIGYVPKISNFVHLKTNLF